MKLEDIRTICAIGSGTMGLGTALRFAMAGYDVRLYIQQRENENIQEKIASRMSDLQVALESFVSRGLVAADDAPIILARVTPTSSLAEAATGADFVMESVDENLELKQSIFQELDKYCPTAILATNTSGLNPSEIAEALPYHMKGNVVVAHFFTPPQLVPLVEVVPGNLTCEKKVHTTYKLLEALGKTPVALKSTYRGFIVNAVQFPMLAGSCELVTSGIADAATVDKAIREGLNLSEMDIAGDLKKHIEKRKREASTSRGRALYTFLAKAMHQVTKDLRGSTPISDDKLAKHIVSRIKTVMLEAASPLCEEGIATPELIEKAIKSSIALRLPQTGPLESADLGGLDTFKDIFTNTLQLPVPKLIEDALAKGHIGLKKGCMHGIYAWAADEATALRTRRVDALFANLEAQHKEMLATSPDRPNQAAEHIAQPSAGIAMPDELVAA